MARRNKKLQKRSGKTKPTQQKTFTLPDGNEILLPDLPSEQSRITISYPEAGFEYQSDLSSAANLLMLGTIFVDGEESTNPGHCGIGWYIGDNHNYFCGHAWCYGTCDNGGASDYLINPNYPLNCVLPAVVPGLYIDNCNYFPNHSQTSAYSPSGNADAIAIMWNGHVQGWDYVNNIILSPDGGQGISHTQVTGISIGMSGVSPQNGFDPNRYISPGDMIDDLILYRASTGTHHRLTDESYDRIFSNVAPYNVAQFVYMGFDNAFIQTLAPDDPASPLGNEVSREIIQVPGPCNDWNHNIYGLISPSGELCDGVCGTLYSEGTNHFYSLASNYCNEGANPGSQDDYAECECVEWEIPGGGYIADNSYDDYSLGTNEIHFGPPITDIPTILPGDVNEDGTLNVQDIVILVNMIVNPIIPPESIYQSFPQADIYEDGIINVLDVVQMIQLILNNPNTSQRDRQELQRQLDRLGDDTTQSSGRTKPKGKLQRGGRTKPIPTKIQRTPPPTEIGTGVVEKVYTTKKLFALIDSRINKKYRDGGRTEDENCNEECLSLLKSEVAQQNNWINQAAQEILHCQDEHGQWDEDCLIEVGAIAAGAAAGYGILDYFDAIPWISGLIDNIRSWLPYCDECQAPGELGWCLCDEVCFFFPGVTEHENDDGTTEYLLDIGFRWTSHYEGPLFGSLFQAGDIDDVEFTECEELVQLSCEERGMVGCPATEYSYHWDLDRNGNQCISQAWWDSHGNTVGCPECYNTCDCPDGKYCNTNLMWHPDTQNPGGTCERWNCHAYYLDWGPNTVGYDTCVGTSAPYGTGGISGDAYGCCGVKDFYCHVTDPIDPTTGTPYGSTDWNGVCRRHGACQNPPGEAQHYECFPGSGFDDSSNSCQSLWPLRSEWCSNEPDCDSCCINPPCGCECPNGYYCDAPTDEESCYIGQCVRIGEEGGILQRGGRITPEPKLMKRVRKKQRRGTPTLSEQLKEIERDLDKLSDNELIQLAQELDIVSTKPVPVTPTAPVVPTKPKPLKPTIDDSGMETYTYSTSYGYGAEGLDRCINGYNWDPEESQDVLNPSSIVPCGGICTQEINMELWQEDQPNNPCNPVPGGMGWSPECLPYLHTLCNQQSPQGYNLDKNLIKCSTYSTTTNWTDYHNPEATCCSDHTAINYNPYTSIEEACAHLPLSELEECEAWLDTHIKYGTCLGASTGNFCDPWWECWNGNVTCDMAKNIFTPGAGYFDGYLDLVDFASDYCQLTANQNDCLNLPKNILNKFLECKMSEYISDFKNWSEEILQGYAGNIGGINFDWEWGSVPMPGLWGEQGGEGLVILDTVLGTEMDGPSILLAITDLDIDYPSVIWRNPTQLGSCDPYQNIANSNSLGCWYPCPTASIDLYFNKFKATIPWNFKPIALGGPSIGSTQATAGIDCPEGSSSSCYETGNDFFHLQITLSPIYSNGVLEDFSFSIGPETGFGSGFDVDPGFTEDECSCGCMLYDITCWSNCWYGCISAVVGEFGAGIVTDIFEPSGIANDILRMIIEVSVGYGQYPLGLELAKHINWFTHAYEEAGLNEYVGESLLGWQSSYFECQTGQPHPDCMDGSDESFNFPEFFEEYYGLGGSQTWC